MDNGQKVKRLFLILTLVYMTFKPILVQAMLLNEWKPQNIQTQIATQDKGPYHRWRHSI